MFCKPPDPEVGLTDAQAAQRNTLSLMVNGADDERIRPELFTPGAHQIAARLMLDLRAETGKVDVSDLTRGLLTSGVENAIAWVAGLIAEPVHIDQLRFCIDELELDAYWRTAEECGEKLLRCSRNGRHPEDVAEVLDRLRPQPARRSRRRNMADAVKQFHGLAEPVVDGLFRFGETWNLNATTKGNKTYTGIHAALSVATGREFLGRYRTTRGKVLYIDNELHEPTFDHRVKTVSEAMQLRPQEFDGWFEAENLRGDLQDIRSIVSGIGDGYTMVVIDALYRALPAGASENDNAVIAEIYNYIDRAAARFKTSIGFIHHTTKGSQADKRTTDVGSGAGSFSRAADAHLVLREHEEPGCCTLDAAIRSFAPLEPVVLRWKFPLWEIADELDPTALKRAKSIGQQANDAKDREGRELLLKYLGAATTVSKLATQTGIGKPRIRRLINGMVETGEVVQLESTTANNGHAVEWFQTPNSGDATW